MRATCLHRLQLRLKSVAAALSAHHGSDLYHGNVPGHQLFCFYLPGQLYQDEDKKIAILWYSVFGVDDFCPTNQRSKVCSANSTCQ
jgi:hypothetical protein